MGSRRQLQHGFAVIDVVVLGGGLVFEDGPRIESGVTGWGRGDRLSCHAGVDLVSIPSVMPDLIWFEQWRTILWVYSLFANGE